MAASVTGSRIMSIGRSRVNASGERRYRYGPQKRVISTVLVRSPNSNSSPAANSVSSICIVRLWMKSRLRKTARPGLACQRSLIAGLIPARCRTRNGTIRSRMKTSSKSTFRRTTFAKQSIRRAAGFTRYTRSRRWFPTAWRTRIVFV